tara:strand:+ start:68 stop:1132 length:1065 start_codon:yes stop_codon:yes gene_type:complete
MQLALNQAKKNLGNTKSNPSVGCVITKNGNLVSVGNTGIGGRPHAEVDAINSSKVNLKKSNMYVTLEPCSHYGITPPCTKAIIKSKIRKVFFSLKDPDIRSFDKSAKILRRYGIKTIYGLLSNRLNEFYKSYFIYKKNYKLPYVTCKLAVSKDYFTVDKKSKWITNNLSRGRVHLIRSFHDCIVTSSKTVINDNPLLTCRIPGLEKKSPTRIIIDKYLSTPKNSKVILTSKKYKTIIFYNIRNKSKISFYKKKNIKLYKIELDKKKNIDLSKVLVKIKKLGFSRVLIEGGEKITTSFLKDDLVNDFLLFISKKKLSINGKKSIKKYFNTYLKNKKFTAQQVNLHGEKFNSYRIK